MKLEKKMIGKKDIIVMNKGKRDKHGDTREDAESDNAVPAVATAVAGDRIAETSVRVTGA